MARIPVESSNLSHVEYDGAAEELRVWFHSGGPYTYLGVPQAAYDGLMSAPSKGSYFYRHIRDEYDCEKPD